MTTYQSRNINNALRLVEEISQMAPFSLVLSDVSAASPTVWNGRAVYYLVPPRPF